MTIYDERPESRSWNIAENKGTVEYQLIGLHDENDVANYVRANTPAFRNGAWIQDFICKPQGNKLWYITCPYGPLPKMPGSLKIGFRTTGGTVKIQVSKSMVAKYGTGAPDTKVIGQNAEGADVTIPVQLRSYTYSFDKGIVTEPMMDYWESITGIVNLNVWHNRPAGEVLFLGAEGETTISADSQSSVTFNVAMSKNLTGLTIGALTGVAVQGHDILDVHVKANVTSGAELREVLYAYVHRVYERLDFLTYLGF